MENDNLFLSNLISHSALAEQVSKTRSSDIVFMRKTNQLTGNPVYIAYGKDADRLAEKVSSFAVAMRPEIDGKRYPYASIHGSNIENVKADLMIKNVHPIIIDIGGNRINGDKFLDYTPEQRKAFIDSLKPEAVQLRSISDTLHRMGNPDRVVIHSTQSRTSLLPKMVFPHRIGNKEIALAELIKSKDGSYKAGNKEDGFYPISKMGSNNLLEIDRALKNAEKLTMPNLLKELQNQIQSGNAIVGHDFAKGRFLITINDPEGRNGAYERGFKQFTFGEDLNNEILLHNDWENRATPIRVDPQLAQQLSSYTRTFLMKEEISGFKEATGIELTVKDGHPYYDGDLDLSHSRVKSLPDGLEVKGFLAVIDSKVERLPENLVVGRYLDASFSKITELPKNLSVGGGLGLGYTHVSRLPENLEVNGWLDLENTDVRELPKGLTVNGGLYLDGSKVRELPRDLRTTSLHMGGRTIDDTPDVVTPGGYIDLDKADLPVVQLPREQLSPLMRHYADTKKTYPNIVPLYHFDDRYETYHRDADRVAKAMRMEVQTSATHIAPDGSPARFVSVSQSDFWKLSSRLVADRIPYQVIEDMSRARSREDAPRIERNESERRELSQPQTEERAYSFHR